MHFLKSCYRRDRSTNSPPSREQRSVRKRLKSRSPPEVDRKSSRKHSSSSRKQKENPDSGDDGVKKSSKQRGGGKSSSGVADRLALERTQSHFEGESTFEPDYEHDSD